MKKSRQIRIMIDNDKLNRQTVHIYVRAPENLKMPVQ